MYWRVPIVVHGRLPRIAAYITAARSIATGLAHGLQHTGAAAIFSAARRLAKRRPLARRVTLERIVESRILIDRTRLSRCAPRP